MPNSEERTSVGRQRWHSHDRSLSIRSVNQRHGSSSNSPRACCAAVVLCRSWQCWSPTRSNRRMLVVECPGWGLFFTVPHGNTPCMVSAKGAISSPAGHYRPEFQRSPGQSGPSRQRVRPILLLRSLVVCYWRASASPRHVTTCAATINLATDPVVLTTESRTSSYSPGAVELCGD